MSLLVIDENRSKVDRISGDEWRVVRMLRLLDGQENQEVFSALCGKVAGMMAAADKLEPDPDEGIEGYLVELADSARPVGDGFFGMLIDSGRVDDWRGAQALALMTRPSDTIDEVAGELSFAYSALTEEDPGYVRIRDLYDDLTPQQAENAFHEAMLGVVHDWRERFIERLEDAAMHFRKLKVSDVK